MEAKVKKQVKKEKDKEETEDVKVVETKNDGKNDEIDKKQKKVLLRDIDGEEFEGPMKINRVQYRYIVYGVYGLLVLMGIFTGYSMSKKGVGATRKPEEINTETVVGVEDTAAFKDIAEGIIEKGGLDGEGTHKLIREGGPSQTAYIMSSIVDLDQFTNKKVKVWGQTMQAEKASWLMDIGKIELLSQ